MVVEFAWSSVAAVVFSQSFAAFGFAVTGLGGGILFTVCWSLFAEFGLTSGTVRDAVSLIYIHGAIACSVMTWRLREHVHWPFCIGVSVLWIIFQLLGIFVLLYVDGVLLTRSLGCGLLFVFLFQYGLHYCASSPRSRAAGDDAEGNARTVELGTPVLADADLEFGQEGRNTADMAAFKNAGIKEDPATPDQGQRLESDTDAAARGFEDPGANSFMAQPPGSVDEAKAQLEAGAGKFHFSRSVIVGGAGMGIGGGFLSGLVGIPLPALLAFSLLTDMPKDMNRATNSAIGCFSTPWAIYYFFVTTGGYEPSMVPLYCAAAVGTLLGLPLGDIMSSRMDQSTFRQILMSAMFFGALLMATKGIYMSVEIIGGLGIACVASGCFVSAWKRRVQRNLVSAASQS